ncbi:type II secretion system protein GspG, partial [Escherichia coli]
MECNLRSYHMNSLSRTQKPRAGFTLLEV